MQIVFEALPSAEVNRIRRERLDSYGNPVERHLSDGEVYPCRHCLEAIPNAAGYLILAHRPFRSQNPYAETGPIFLCEVECERAMSSDTTPEILRAPDYIVRGYSAEERIVYGSGLVTPTGQIADYARHLLARPEIAFVDVRSARNNCYQCRIRQLS